MFTELSFEIECILENIENAQYNLKICKILKLKIIAIKCLIEILRSDWESSSESEDLLKIYTYLTNAKTFIIQVYQLNTFAFYHDVEEMGERFLKIDEEYLKIKELFQDKIGLYLKNEIDDVNHDILDMKNFLLHIDGGIIKNSEMNIALKEIIFYKNELRKDDLTFLVPTNLNDSSGFMNFSIRIIKEYLVDERLADHRFAIWEKLKNSNNILKFHGISKNETQSIIVIEKTEMGTLENLYKSFMLSLDSKVAISIGICRAIIYLHSCELYHENICCKNIMMTEQLVLKLTNFRLMSYVNYEDNEQSWNAINWVAPELLNKNKYKFIEYNFNCDIYSFGMTLWELIFERIPFEGLSMKEITMHVLSKRREKLYFDEDNDTDVQKELFAIINSAWQDNALLRMPLQLIFLRLNGIKIGESQNQSNLIRKSSEKKMNKELLVEDSSQINILTIEDAILQHKEEKNHTIAFKWFEFHAKLGNYLAKYWFGYYLSEGYSCQKDKAKGSSIYKEVADEGYPDAQLRYAFSLVEVKADFKQKYTEVFLHYLKLAARNNNITAIFNLGDIYYHGKLNVTKNIQLGKQYLELAALLKHPKAIDMLSSL